MKANYFDKTCKDAKGEICILRTFDSGNHCVMYENKVTILVTNGKIHTTFSWNSPTKDIFNVSDYTPFTIDRNVIIKKAKKIAKNLNIPYKAKVKFNDWGGIENGLKCVYVNDFGTKILLSCTCSNCGDGHTINLTNL